MTRPLDIEQHAPARDCVMVYDAMLADGGWHTVQTIVNHWHPTYTAEQVRRILTRLYGDGLVQRAMSDSRNVPVMWSADLQLPPPAPPVRHQPPPHKPSLHPLQQCWSRKPRESQS